MNLNEQKQQFSTAFVRAVAAQCGLAYAVPETDDDSIDATVAKRGGGGSVRSPKLDLQLKATAGVALTPAQTHFSYPLLLKNYDELRPTNVQVPRILVVVLVPNVLADWMDCGEAAFALRSCAYWLSLRGMAPTTNASSITLQIPRTNVFAPAALNAIFANLQLGLNP